MKTRILVLSLIATLGQSQKRGKWKKKSPKTISMKPSKIMSTFTKYLCDKIPIDENEGIVHSQRQVRLTKLRCEFVKSQYSNKSKINEDAENSGFVIPASLKTWYKQVQTSKFKTNCKNRNLAECSTFVPMEQVYQGSNW